MIWKREERALGTKGHSSGSRAEPRPLRSCRRGFDASPISAEGVPRAARQLDDVLSSSGLYGRLDGAQRPGAGRRALVVAVCQLPRGPHDRAQPVLASDPQRRTRPWTGPSTEGPREVTRPRAWGAGPAAGNWRRRPQLGRTAGTPRPAAERQPPHRRGSRPCGGNHFREGPLPAGPLPGRTTSGRGPLGAARGSQSLAGAPGRSGRPVLGAVAGAPRAFRAATARAQWHFQRLREEKGSVGHTHPGLTLAEAAARPSPAAQPGTDATRGRPRQRPSRLSPHLTSKPQSRKRPMFSAFWDPHTPERMRPTTPSPGRGRGRCRPIPTLAAEWSCPGAQAALPAATCHPTAPVS